jgi:hypothetical protein
LFNYNPTIQISNKQVQFLSNFKFSFFVFFLFFRIRFSSFNFLASFSGFERQVRAFPLPYLLSLQSRESKSGQNYRLKNNGGFLPLRVSISQGINFGWFEKGEKEIMG